MDFSYKRINGHNEKTINREQQLLYLFNVTIELPKDKRDGSMEKFHLVRNKQM